MTPISRSVSDNTRPAGFPKRRWLDEPICPGCGSTHLGCEDFGCVRPTASGMVRNAIAHERRVNVVNIILSAALIVAIVGLVWGVIL